VAAGAALSLSLTGCGRSQAAATAAPGGPARTDPANRPSVDSAVLAQVQARVLVDATGYPLYIYVPDRQKAVTCAGECAVVWPPVFDAAHAHVQAGPGVEAGLLGTDPDPVAGTVVTYNRWPLYTYAEDPQPGFATGEGLDVDGGLWYLIRPDGAPLVPAP
jgi:predicted lipoprotein with Yx(FWY)xxD motif